MPNRTKCILLVSSTLTRRAMHGIAGAALPQRTAGAGRLRQRQARQRRTSAKCPETSAMPMVGFRRRLPGERHASFSHGIIACQRGRLGLCHGQIPLLPWFLPWLDCTSAGWHAPMQRAPEATITGIGSYLRPSKPSANVLLFVPSRTAMTSYSYPPRSWFQPSTSFNQGPSSSHSIRPSHRACSWAWRHVRARRPASITEMRSLLVAV
jgi:hypothetical protein